MEPDSHSVEPGPLKQIEEDPSAQVSHTYHRQFWRARSASRGSSGPRWVLRAHGWLFGWDQAVKTIRKMIERLAHLPQQRVLRQHLLEHFCRQDRRFAESTERWGMALAKAEARSPIKALTCVREQQRQCRPAIGGSR